MSKKAIIMALTAALFLAVLSAGTAHAQDEPIRIGVLAERGKERCLEKWSATADYLGEKIPDESFVIVPLDFEEVYPAAENRRVDFILVNSSFYVELEVWYGVSRIATLSNSRLGKAVTVYGGVLFCRADNSEINSLADLRGKRFMAVKETSFGGWRTAWRELKEQGIEPEGDFVALEFGGTHDGVVYAVRDGEVDAGTVRTDTLERMAAEGKIDIKDFNIINRVEDDFPFVHSTRLYPEWPFAKLKHTPNDLAEEVSAALLTMSPESKAARDAKCTGWTIPLSYQPVHNCLKELRVGPYKDFGRVTLGDAVKQHWYWLAVVVVFLLLMAVATMYTVRLNRRLSRIQSALQEELSERRRAEETARKEAAKLAAMISGMDEGVIFADAENVIVEVNDYFCRFVGKERDAIVGRKIEELHKVKAFEHILDQVARFRSNPDSGPHVLQRPLGGAEVILRVQPIYRENRYEGVLLNVINVTELIQARRQAEAASRELEKRVNELEESRAAVLNMMEDMEEAHRVLKETQAQLIQQEKMSSIGTLAAGVAHEFNNILTGIMGFASLARADNSKVPQLAEIVLRESERAATITRNLLSFSRRREQSLAPAGMRLLVEEVLSLTRRDFEKADIAIQTHYSETPPVMAEAGQIEQVLLNTFINAHHAMERGGTLTITVATEGEEVVVRISDTGSGISEENLSKIFDPFFSTKGVWGKDKQAGTGLGLSVSRNIIEAHKGRIEVESEVGVGTTFTIRLPAAEGTDGVTPTRLTRKFMQETKDSYRVLVADDEELLRDLLVEILGSLGHEVTVVSSGEAVLEEVQKAKYDYLFLDIMMPGRYDGAAVLEKIEEMGSDVKVFICTGKVEDENLLDLLEKAHGYVRKPFTMNEIASLLGSEAGKEEAVARMSGLG